VVCDPSFLQKSSTYGPYAQRHVHPRIFNAFDTKRDGVIDFEEYLCGVTVFRAGGAEEKMKCKVTSSSYTFQFAHPHTLFLLLVGIFIMYEGIKSGGSMTK